MSEPSPEVKQAAEKIHARALTLFQGWEPQIAEAIIQQAIDAATAKLREELEQQVVRGPNVNNCFDCILCDAWAWQREILQHKPNCLLAKQLAHQQPSARCICVAGYKMGCPIHGFKHPAKSPSATTPDVEKWTAGEVKAMLDEWGKFTHLPASEYQRIADERNADLVQAREPLTKLKEELRRIVETIVRRTAQSDCGVELNVKTAMAEFDQAAWQLAPSATTPDVEKLAQTVRDEFLCDCEVCQHSAAVCPASASSLILEVAELRYSLAQARESLEYWKAQATIDWHKGFAACAEAHEQNKQLARQQPSDEAQDPSQHQ